MKYRGYTIFIRGGNYLCDQFREEAANLKTMKKWIDCDILAKRPRPVSSTPKPWKPKPPPKKSRPGWSRRD